ncbi:MAG: LAGLIDADG family homing endonuclease [Sedimenticola sp.]
MAEYKSVNSLSPTDAAYIARLIDGEGTISLTRRHKNERRQLVISISNTELELLDYALKTIGAGKITNTRRIIPPALPTQSAIGKLSPC